MRARFIVFGVVFVLLVAAWFLVLYRPNQTRIRELNDEQAQVQQQIADLQAQLQRLRELERIEPQLRAEQARLRDALPNDPRIPDFILQVQEAANLAGIDFLSITPSVPTAATGEAAAGQLQTIAVTISTTGRFFELEDFIIRLERLRRVVKINAFSLAGGGADASPEGSPSMSVSFQMEIYMVGQPPAAAPPAGAPPAAGASPAPGETPAPTPAPGETPIPTAAPGA